MAIVGMSGHIGSGKSLTSEILHSILKEEGITVAVKSFAQPIYKLVSDMTGLPISEIKSKKRKHESLSIGEITTTYRGLLQMIGDGLRDHGSSDIWINSMFGVENQKAITDLTWINSWWIIDDLRYPNEAEKIKSLGGKLIRVERDESENNSHRAETSLDSWNDWDIVIKNDYPSVSEAKDKIRVHMKGFVKEILYG